MDHTEPWAGLQGALCQFYLMEVDLKGPPNRPASQTGKPRLGGRTVNQVPWQVGGRARAEAHAQCQLGAASLSCDGSS